MEYFWALLEKYKDFIWNRNERRIWCNNVDLVLKLKDGRFCFNRLFNLFFGFSEPANDLILEVSRFPGILSGFPKVADCVELFPSSVVAFELYNNLLFCKPCWELKYPKQILSRVWLDPEYPFDGQIGGIYLLPAIVRKRFCRKRVLNDSYRSYLRRKITKLFKNLLLDYSNNSFLTELSYQALNPRTRCFIREIVKKSLGRLTSKSLHRVRSVLAEFLCWIDLSDADFLKLLL